MATKKQELPEADPHLLERAGTIKPEELAAYLQKAVGTLDKWASRGYGPAFIKVGHDRRYLPEDVIAWMKANRHEHTDAA